MTTQQLNNLSIEELRTLNRKIVRAINVKKHQKSLDMKDTLGIGDTVRVNHPKYSGVEFRVQRVKRTKAILSFTDVSNPQRFDVPMSMIEAA